MNLHKGGEGGLCLLPAVCPGWASTGTHPASPQEKDGRDENEDERASRTARTPSQIREHQAARRTRLATWSPGGTGSCGWREHVRPRDQANTHPAPTSWLLLRGQGPVHTQHSINLGTREMSKEEPQGPAWHCLLQSWQCPTSWEHS